MIPLTSVDLSDLAGIQTWPDFAAYLKSVQRQSGHSLVQLERAGKRLAGANPRLRELPRSTVSDVLRGKRPIKKDLLETLLAACEVPPAQAAQLIVAWERINSTVGQGPANACHVDEASPRDLGIHPAIAGEDMQDELPTYVRRDFDDELRDQIAQGVEKGCFVLLVGRSSCGKTRSLYEALQFVVRDWWLVQPAKTQDIHDLITTPTERTVLWLDELVRYLGADPPLHREDLLSLIRTTGTIVVSTLWPEHYFNRNGRQPGGDDADSEDRLLIEFAKVIQVPETFSGKERQRAAKAAIVDSRIKKALESPDAGVTQVLAAAPQLVMAWDQAPDPYSKAIISAAADAYRLGVQSPLSAKVLAAAMTDYLTPAQRAKPVRIWLELGLGHATRQLHGAISALTPVSRKQAGNADGYLIADYLAQHIGRVRRTECPPDSLWAASITHTDDPDDLRRLVSSATARMRYRYAEQALRRLRQTGDDDSVVPLLQLLRREDRFGEAIALADDWLAARPADQQRRIVRAEMLRIHLRAEQLRDHANHDPRSAELLGELLADGGRADALRLRSANGDVVAFEDLTELLASRGYLDELKELAIDNLFAAERLDDLLASLGREEELEQRAHSGDPIASVYLDRIREQRTGVGEAGEDLAGQRAAAHSGDQEIAAELVANLFESGDREALLAEVNAGTLQAADRYLALLTADPAVDRDLIRRIRLFGLRTDGTPSGPGAKA